MTTCIWFVNSDGEEAAKYYVDTFNSAPGGVHHGELGDITKATKEGEEISKIKEGTVMTLEYTLDGSKFMALNGGPLEQFKLNGSVSFIVECETQEEIDHFWEKLSAVPEAEQCGWCTDRFGITWQITPRILDELMKDPTRAEAVTKVFMPMKKLDLEAIKKAATVE
ncbi:MAG TPA: VOC family protein [Patescibacteria group bacterium]|nr:VOC family protein [Patescibacteria group bacterium]